MAPKKESVDDDPVDRTYDVFITPELQQKLYLLQFPVQEREKPYNEQHDTKPVEMRVKPRSGFVEVDVPIPTDRHYDKTKGKAWKKALETARSEGSNGHGMASGFLTATGPRLAPGARHGSRAADMELDDEDDEDEEGLAHQTLGGQINPNESGRPVYMIGTFRHNPDQLHLTTLDAIVQMRPQFHHIDAKTQVERNKLRRDKEVVEQNKPSEPRLVHQTARSAEAAAAAADAYNAKDLLQAAHEEQWTQLDYLDEEEEQAYALYHDRLFYNHDGHPPKLSSSLDNETYLERMSAPRLDSKGRARVKPLAKKPKVQLDTSDAELSDPDRAR